MAAGASTPGRDLADLRPLCDRSLGRIPDTKAFRSTFKRSQGPPGSFQAASSLAFRRTIPKVLQVGPLLRLARHELPSRDGLGSMAGQGAFARLLPLAGDPGGLLPPSSDGLRVP